MAQDSPQQLLIRMREHAGRVSAGEEYALTQPIQNNFKMSTNALNAVWSDGGRYYSTIDRVMAHTSAGGGVQAGQTDPAEFALRLGVFVKDLETRQAAELGQVIGQNSDGTFLSVSRVMF